MVSPQALRQGTRRGATTLLGLRRSIAHPLVCLLAHLLVLLRPALVAAGALVQARHSHRAPPLLPSTLHPPTPHTHGRRIRPPGAPPRPGPVVYFQWFRWFRWLRWLSTIAGLVVARCCSLTFCLWLQRAPPRMLVVACQIGSGAPPQSSGARASECTSPAIFVTASAFFPNYLVLALNLSFRSRLSFFAFFARLSLDSPYLLPCSPGAPF